MFFYLLLDDSTPIKNKIIPNETTNSTTTIMPVTSNVTTTITCTTVVTTTITTTMTTTTTTTTVAEQKPPVEKKESEVQITEVVETTEEIEVTEAPSIEADTETSDDTYIHQGTFEATWYDNRGLGKSEDSVLFGSSGRDLISGYSVASNYFSSGTILYIEGGGLDGYYRVDDTGGMANNVLDFYYQRRSDVPSNFKRDGRYNVQVYIVE